MKYYHFRTFTTSYYFPTLNKDRQYLYGLYSAYGGKLSRWYWWLFRKNGVVRSLHRVDEKELDFPYTLIRETEGHHSLMAFNMGSPGKEQKISILGYDAERKEPFFAKFAQKEAAKALSRNEIAVLQKLADTGLSPALITYKITPDFVFLKTEYVNGKRPVTIRLTPEVMTICIRLLQYRLTPQLTNPEGLRISLSHGDFCPWNLLEHENKLRLIDWEMADDRPLGYDLFTYIFQTAFLFSDKETEAILKENRPFIEDYFSQVGVDNYIPYLKAFSEIKSAYEQQKDKTSDSYKKYRKLSYFLTTLS